MTCSHCRQPKADLAEFRDPLHGFARVCRPCWEAAGREQGWLSAQQAALLDVGEIARIDPQETSGSGAWDTGRRKGKRGRDG